MTGVWHYVCHMVFIEPGHIQVRVISNISLNLFLTLAKARPSSWGKSRDKKHYIRMSPQNNSTKVQEHFPWPVCSNSYFCLFQLCCLVTEMSAWPCPLEAVVTCQHGCWPPESTLTGTALVIQSLCPTLLRSQANFSLHCLGLLNVCLEIKQCSRKAVSWCGHSNMDFPAFLTTTPTLSLSICVQQWNRVRLKD